MRIIAGTHRGRKLETIQGRNIRPTSDRTREAVFSILGPKVKNAAVLDLFAGTGALALEAVSRGARQAVLVDSSEQSCEIIRRNISRCRETDRCRVVCCDLGQGIPEGITGGRYDLVFMDPPYGLGYIEKIAGTPLFFSLLHHETIIVAEHSFRDGPLKPIRGLDIYRQKKYSKTFVSFLRINSEDCGHERES